LNRFAYSVQPGIWSSDDYCHTGAKCKFGLIRQGVFGVVGVDETLEDENVGNEERFDADTKVDSAESDTNTNSAIIPSTPLFNVNWKLANEPVPAGFCASYEFRRWQEDALAGLLQDISAIWEASDAANRNLEGDSHLNCLDPRFVGIHQLIKALSGRGKGEDGAGNNGNGAENNRISWWEVMGGVVNNTTKIKAGLQEYEEHKAAAKRERQQLAVKQEERKNDYLAAHGWDLEGYDSETDDEDGEMGIPGKGDGVDSADVSPENSNPQVVSPKARRRVEQLQKLLQSEEVM
jgi:hypothetical protein